MLPEKVALVASSAQATAHPQRITNSIAPTGADRLLGAVVCSGEAAVWMISAFLWVAFWCFKLTLMVGFAVLRIRLK
jgi:hypothetical protein